MKIDYSLLQKDVETAKKVLENQAKDHYPGVLETVRKLVNHRKIPFKLIELYVSKF